MESEESDIFPIAEIDGEETWQEAIAREMRSVFGLENAQILGEVGEIKKDNQSIHFYLIKSEQVDIKNAKWITENELLEKIKDEETKKIFQKALKEINNQ